MSATKASLPPFDTRHCSGEAEQSSVPNAAWSSNDPVTRRSATWGDPSTMMISPEVSMSNPTSSEAPPARLAHCQNSPLSSFAVKMSEPPADCRVVEPKLLVPRNDPVI